MEDFYFEFSLVVYILVWEIPWVCKRFIFFFKLVCISIFLLASVLLTYTQKQKNKKILACNQGLWLLLWYIITYFELVGNWPTNTLISIQHLHFPWVCLWVPTVTNQQQIAENQDLLLRLSNTGGCRIKILLKIVQPKVAIYKSVFRLFEILENISYEFFV